MFGVCCRICAFPSRLCQLSSLPFGFASFPPPIHEDRATQAQPGTSEGFLVPHLRARSFIWLDFGVRHITPTWITMLPPTKVRWRLGGFVSLLQGACKFLFPPTFMEDGLACVVGQCFSMGTDGNSIVFFNNLLFSASTSMVVGLVQRSWRNYLSRSGCCPRRYAWHDCQPPSYTTVYCCNDSIRFCPLQVFAGLNFSILSFANESYGGATSLDAALARFLMPRFLCNWVDESPAFWILNIQNNVCKLTK